MSQVVTYFSHLVYGQKFFRCFLESFRNQKLILLPDYQRMTDAEHNRPIPKLFGNQTSAYASEVFCETICLVIYIQKYP